ncbi:MAG TPA: invasin domain 3-containing protein, partial [Urbifossiella sp.]|nr:invasin domain 3-containing protein [Urbifossiella sp.]
AFTLALAGGSSTGSFGTVTETGTPGTYTTNFTGNLAGTASSLTAKVNGVTLTTQPTVQVTPGSVSASQSTAGFASSTDVSGATDLTTVVVKDAAGNVISGLANAAFNLTLAGGSSTGSFGTVIETATPGTYTTQFTGNLAGTATTLTAKVNGVSLTMQPTVQVTSGSVSAGKSTVSFASSTDVSGSTDLVTIVVKDAGNNALTGLSNAAFTLTLAGGSTGSFGTVTETGTPGTYTAQFTGVAAGSAATLTATVNGVSLTAQPTVQVTAGPVSASQSTVNFASSTDVSGSADLTTIVVKDAAGNAITGLANAAFSFTLAGGSTTGSFGTVTETSTPGTYTAQFTGSLAGTASTLTAKVNGVSLTTKPTVQVTVGPVSASKSTVSFASSTDVSGSTDLTTLVVKDAAGNAITGLANAAFSLTLAGGGSTGSFGTVTETATPGIYTTNFTGNLAGAAATLTAKVNGVSLTTKPTVQVTAGSVSASRSTVSFASASDVLGTTDLVTIAVKDAAGNAISGLTSANFALSLTGASQGSFGIVAETATPGTYRTAFIGLVTGTPSTLSTTVQGVSLTAHPTVQVTTATVSGSNSTANFASFKDPVGTIDLLTIAVKDGNGNPVTGLSSSAFTQTLAGGSSSGQFGTVTESAVPGTYTVAFTGAQAGTPSSLTIAVSGVTLNAQPTVEVTVSSMQVGYPTILVGVDSGVPSSIEQYTAAGTLANTFTPFPGFTGGLRVAVGDFTGDGSLDYAVGTGPGVTAEVKIIDGTTGAVLFDVQPFDSFDGGVFVAAGSLSGNGVDSLVITPDQGGGPRVEVYQFESGQFARTNNFFALENPFFRGGARAAVGDINADGFADVIVAAGFGGGPVVEVYDGHTLDQQQKQSILIPDFYAFDPSLRNGAYVAMGDIDGDGFGDLVIGAGPGGGPRVLVVSGQMLLNQGSIAAEEAPIANFFGGSADNRGGIRVAVANLDGDARADVLTGSGRGGGSQVAAYMGSNLTSGNPTAAESFDAFPGYLGGVFVG